METGQIIEGMEDTDTIEIKYDNDRAVIPPLKLLVGCNICI